MNNMASAKKETPLACSVLNKILDQFVILGVPSDDQNILLKEQNKSKIRFVLKDVFPKETLERGYLNNLHLWCLKDNAGIFDERGYPLDIATGRVIQSKERDIKISEKACLQHFVITNESGERRYCTSLQVYERRKVIIGREDSFKLVYVPKAYCILSSFNCFEVQKQILSYLFKEVIFSLLSGGIEKGVQFSEKTVSIFEKYSHNYGFREAQKIQVQNQYENLNLNVKEEYLFGFVLSKLLTFETIENRESAKLIKILVNSKEVFQFKCNYNSFLRPFFHLDNFSYKPLLQKLSIPTILEILQAIFLEKQIIIFAKDTSDIAHLCEALFAFIQPLSWKCLYIPSLPTQMLETFEIIVPYIIGINRSAKDQVLSSVSSENKLFLDLDTDYIIQEGIEMPSELKNNLKEQLKEQMREYKEIFRKKKDMDSAEQTIAFARLILNVKKVFLHFMISLINNYCSFFLYPTDFDYQRSTENEIFDFKAYLRFLGNTSSFFSDFATKTMIFRGFIEDSYKVFRQVEVFGKDLREAGQIENVSPFLIEFILEIKKVNAYILLEGNQGKQINNVNLFRYPYLLSTLHLEHNVIISNYLQEISHPKIIETQGELLKYLIFNQNQDKNISPFQSPAKRIPTIALDRIDTVPILNLDFIENDADKTISCKQEQEKKFIGGPRMHIDNQGNEERIKQQSVPQVIKQIPFIEDQPPIQDLSAIIASYHSPNTILHQSSVKAVQNISSFQKMNSKSQLSEDPLSFNNASSFNQTTTTSRTPNSTYSRSPYSTSSQLNQGERKKMKIFEAPTSLGGSKSLSRERNNGNLVVDSRNSKINFYQNTITGDQEKKIAEEDFQNKSDIPEENAVETVPDFFKAEMEMKNIVNLNIDQITCYHTFKVKSPEKREILKQNYSQSSHQKDAFIKVNNLQGLTSHYFFPENASSAVPETLTLQKQINLKAPFSAIPMNESWRYNSDMISASSHFLKTDGDELQSKDFVFQTQPTVEEEQNYQNGLIISPAQSIQQMSLNFTKDVNKQQFSVLSPKIEYKSLQFTSPIRQTQQVISPTQQLQLPSSSSRTWAQKKVDFFQTENVLEEEETESYGAEQNQNAQNTISDQQSNIRIKDDPINLKEYFSYSKQSNRFSSQQSNNNNTINQSNSQVSQTINPSSHLQSKNSSSKKRSSNSSHNIILQISSQIQNKSKNSINFTELKKNNKAKIFKESQTLNLEQFGRSRPISSHSNNRQTESNKKPQNQMNLVYIKPQENKLQDPKLSQDTFSRIIPKTAKISLSNPIKEISNQHSSSVNRRLSSQPTSLNNKNYSDLKQISNQRHSLDCAQLPQQNFKSEKTSRAFSQEVIGDKNSGNVLNKPPLAVKQNNTSINFYKPLHKVASLQFQQYLEGKGINTQNKENNSVLSKRNQ